MAKLFFALIFTVGIIASTNAVAIRFSNDVSTIGPEPTPSPTISSAACADLNGVKSHSTGQCFIHVNETKTFIQAELHCESLNGHLTSIHSGFDNLLVADFAREIFPSIDQYYVGLTRFEGNNDAWQDGTRVDYTDYGYQNYGQLCTTVIMNDATWTRTDCFTQAYFVCSV
uniref:C-type lectin domain-containing protein n=1 Tax=Panagrellus redivivus TaxID=6233 RepID=A0A7E4V7V8_PANRE